MQLGSGPRLLLRPAQAVICSSSAACHLQVQRRAVRDWDIVKSLFGLVWEPPTQLPALRMVCSCAAA